MYKNKLFSSKNCLQPVSKPVEQVSLLGGGCLSLWVPWVSKQTGQADRTGGRWVQSPFGADAEQTDRQTDRTDGASG